MKKVLSLILAFAMIMSTMSFTAFAEETLGMVILDSTNSTYTLSQDITGEYGKAAIAVISGDATITVDSDVKVIGDTGAAGIYVAPDASLTIEGTGTLTAIGNAGADGDKDVFGGAGIGGMAGYGNCGNITIDGAKVIANGYGRHAAGIGSGQGGINGAITIINNADVTAYGGWYENGKGTTLQSSYGKSDPEGGAAIGGGSSCGDSTIGNITITDSAVTAFGGSKAAAIGAGYWANAGDITITNSTINAIGGSSSAGIGTSRADNGVTANISITDATVTATGGAYGAGIGSGYNADSVTNLPEIDIAISGGTIVATGGNGGAAIGGGYKTNNLDIAITNGAQITAVAGVLDDGSKTYKQTGACAIGSGANGSGAFVGSTIAIEEGVIVATTTNGGKEAIEGVKIDGTSNADNIKGTIEYSFVNADDMEARVGSICYPTFAEALATVCDANSGSNTVDILKDINLTGKPWTPVYVDGYHGADIVTVNGNNHTITGLSAPIFKGGFAGGSGIVINDLTIDNSDIVSANTLGSGAFIECVDSMEVITLDNCHLLNSSVTGSRTGGLIGWTSGYNRLDDGPVKTYVTVTNCSVIGCTIKGESVAAINGHAGANPWTWTTIENCTIKDNTITSIDDGGWRAGIVVGTANVGEVVINNIIESNNTVTQTDKTMPEGQTTLVGRVVMDTTGKLIIDGIPYGTDCKPYPVSISKTGYQTLKEAAAAAQDGDTITVNSDISDEAVTVTKNVTITSDASNKKTLNNVSITISGKDVELTVSDLKFTGSSYINANDGAALTVTGVEADVDPTKITGRAAFIVAGTGEPTHGLKLVVTDNTILSAQSNTDIYSAAIFGWRYLADGTTIARNTIGSENAPYTFIAIKTMNAMDGATFTIENNTIYGTNEYWKYKAIDLYQNCSRDNTYTVMSKDNNIIVDIDGNNDYSVCAFYLEGNGGTNVILLDNGTTVNGRALMLSDIDASGLPAGYDKFYGVNVELDENSKIIAGELSAIPADGYIADGYQAARSAFGYSVVPATDIAETLSVKFVEDTTKGTEESKVYNIVLKANGDDKINELASAELTFALAADSEDDGAMSFTVLPAADFTLTRYDDLDINRYMFNYNGKTAYEGIGNEIVVGTITVDGFGTFTIGTDKTSVNAKNVVHATTVSDNLVDSYTVEGLNDTDETTGGLDISGNVSGEIEVAKRNLTINITFPNAVENNEVAYQDMTVTIVGGNVNDTIALGTDGEAYNFTRKLPYNTTYTVSVSGAGYRTARYAVTLTENKTLNFWNNVMDNALEVEENKATSATTKNFLAGDIVKDNNINIYDLSAVVAYFGTEGLSKDYKPEYAKYDLNRDGVIDSKDVAYVLVSWGE